MTRLWMVLSSVVVALVVVLAPAAAPDRKSPRIVAAAMLDADRDSRADRVRLTYSERVRHLVDKDGRYPFTVAGYRIRSIGKPIGKTLLVLLAERVQPDPKATPVVRYRRTSSRPVVDLAGNQALVQRFVRTRGHGRVPATPSPPASPPAPPSPADADGDGTPDEDDCAPTNAAIHPGAADTPELGFVDSNCDGIDGTEKDAIFVSPDGNDANPGTKAKPVREIERAVVAAAVGGKRYVLVAFGTYGRVYLSSPISIYGGYDPSWGRRDRYPDGLPLITGQPDGVVVDGAKGVVLQHLKVTGSVRTGIVSDGGAYGIRAIRGASLTLQRVVVSAGNGLAGTSGATGGRGASGGPGGQGGIGSCDGQFGAGTSAGGAGGSSLAERPGGQGGFGGIQSGSSGSTSGQEGKLGTPGGAGGAKGNPGKPGAKGQSGENGGAGLAGSGATGLGDPGMVWVVRAGRAGGTGKPGNGGGGGGGGGAQSGLFANDGTGNAGGGGGGGGVPGIGGIGGTGGGGSFGLYLFDSKVVVEDSTIAAGNGGAGGRGGNGGLGGAGGAAGKGGKVCTSEVGAGGDGGFGGAGGRGGGGGGGAGGPSIGVFKVGTSTVIRKGATKFTRGTAGAGGAGGSSGPGGAGTVGEAGIAAPDFPGSG